jgi:hypothetical protein
MSGKDYQRREIKPITVQDTTLANIGYTCYMIQVGQGVLASQQPKRASVVGPSHPTLDELWFEFSGQTSAAMGSRLEAFVEWLRGRGFVQIEAVVSLGVGY